MHASQTGSSPGWSSHTGFEQRCARKPDRFIITRLEQPDRFNTRLEQPDRLNTKLEQPDGGCGPSVRAAWQVQHHAGASPQPGGAVQHLEVVNWLLHRWTGLIRSQRPTAHHTLIAPFSSLRACLACIPPPLEPGSTPPGPPASPPLVSLASPTKVFIHGSRLHVCICRVSLCLVRA